MRPSMLVAAACAVATTLAARGAGANGQFPASAQIVVQPGDPQHVVVRATFGILPSRDGGFTFDWICESAANYGMGADPGIAITGDGTLLAAVFGGVSTGHGDACAWTLAVPEAFMVDVTVDKAHPATAFAIGTKQVGGYFLWRSDDNAQNWTEVSQFPIAFYPVTVEVAPSDPTRVYASGASFEDGGMAPSIGTSIDAGATWTIAAAPHVAGDPMPFVAGVDPNDADTVWIRPNTTPGVLLVSRDGGSTWKRALKVTGPLQAFAISPDGKTVLAGGPQAGLYAATIGDAAADVTFAKRSSFGAGCLAWPDARVFACGDEQIDGFIVGESDDAGHSFKPRLSTPCVRGPLDCPSGTSVGDDCPMEWPNIAQQIAHDTCADAGTPTSASNASGHAASHAASSSGASSGSAQPPGSGGAAATGGAHGGSGGCGCRTATSEQGTLAALLAALALLMTRRRGREKLEPRKGR